MDKHTRSSDLADATVRWGLLLGFTLLFGSVSLVYPFGRDQAIYAFLGNAILHGMALYRDVPIMLMPMTSLVHALSQVLFGRTPAAIRILDLLWTLATTGMLSLFVAKVFRSHWLGVIAGLIYSFTYYSADHWNTAQVDGFLNLPLVISMYLLAKGLTTGSSSPQPSSRRTLASSGAWFVAGFLMGVALLFKYTVGLLVPGAALVLVFAAGRPRAGNWRTAAWFCIGCVVAGLAAFLVVALSGALPAFIGLQIGTALPYARLYHPASLRGAFSYFHTAALPTFLLGIPGLIAALVTLTKRGKSTPNPALGGALVLMWLVATVASILLQGKFFHYHYLPSLPPLAVLGALAIAIVLRPCAGHLASAWRRAILVTMALAGLALGTDYPARLADLARVASSRLSLLDLWSRPEFSLGKYSVPENLALAEYLEQQTSPSDRVANLDRDTPLTFPSWREPVLRFTAATGIDPASWMLADKFRDNPPDVLTVKRGERFVDSDWAGSQATDEQLMAFAFRHGEVLHWVVAGKRDGYELLMAFTELRDFVAAHYELEARVGHFEVLRLTNSDSVMPVSGGSGALLHEDLDEAMDWLRTRSARTQNSGAENFQSILWPWRVPDNLDSSLSVRMISHKSANRSLWMAERKLSDLLPAFSVWILNDNRPFARQEPFRRQGEGESYDAEGLSFRIRHRCRNGLVFVYDVVRIPVP